MRSTASFQGHPLHPMLIPYPFAFLTGAFGFTLAAAISGRRDFDTVSRHLVPTGVACGLVAAVPGVLDYLGSVPPKSSAKDRALKHALLNTAALGLFTTSWLIGRRGRRPGRLEGPESLEATRTVANGRARGLAPRSLAGPLMLQTLATAAMSVAGYMGGTLVYRNQIGVDHRYAGAGKWREEHAAAGDPAVAADDSLELNQMKLVHRDGQRIVVGRTEDGLVAFDDRCTHKGGPLSDGTLICGVVQCPWHGSQFDTHTGEVKCGPAKNGIETYKVEGK